MNILEKCKLSMRWRLIDCFEWLEVIGTFRETWQYLRNLRKNHEIVPFPSAIKRAYIRLESRKHGIGTLLETGTYLGDTVAYFRNSMTAIYSIEVHDSLAGIARKRFRNSRNVHILVGDSGECLHQVINNISSPCIVWLDGHYSAGITGRGKSDCPIMNELDQLSKACRTRMIVLIDDARLFGVDPAYPTKMQLFNKIRSCFGVQDIYIEMDIIRFYVN